MVNRISQYDSSEGDNLDKEMTELDMEQFSKILAKFLHNHENPRREKVLQAFADDLVDQIANVASGVAKKPMRPQQFSFGYHEKNPDRVAFRILFEGGTTEHEPDQTEYVAVLDISYAKLTFEQVEPDHKLLLKSNFMLVSTKKMAASIDGVCEALGIDTPTRSLTIERIMRDTNN